jgi:tRNA A-37 threonylcarbamoyl transferase component Bud32
MNVFDSANLIALGRHIPTPFHIVVQQTEGEVDITIGSILRIVPGTRLVGICKWKDQTAIVKIFFRPGHWKRSLFRDLQGANLLEQSNIPTPNIIHKTFMADKKGGVLLLDYLESGESLGSLYENARNPREKDELTQKAIQAIARCHEAALWQRDIHLDNFMVVAGRVYIIDGGEIEFSLEKMDLEARINNLALFFAQFPVKMDANVRSLMSYYQEYASGLSLIGVSQLRDRIKSARKKRLTNLERKLFRSTTANRCIQDRSRFVVYDRSIHSEALTAFIHNPDNFIHEKNLLKQGNSSTVATVTIAGRDFVLKRYNIKNMIHGLTRLLRPSRAYHSWRNAAVLKMLGIATPQPFLFMEERVLWFFRRRAYFLCEKVAAENLVLQLKSNDEQRPRIEEVFGAFERLFRIMQEYDISHGDMKATNFIFYEDMLYVLDLDAMARHDTHKKSSALLAKDLTRFRRNWAGTEVEMLANRLIERLQASRTG